MENWDGTERRAVMNLDTEINLMKRDIEYIRGFIEQGQKRFDDHIESSEKYRESVTKINTVLESLSEAFQTHTRNDAWFFALTITTQIGIIIALLKMISK